MLSVELIRVLLVDDHEMLTEGLASRLSTVADLWVLGRLTTEELDRAALDSQLRPDVITVEISSARITGTDLLHQLRTTWPAAHLVVLTVSHDAELVVEAARAGVVAWVSKEGSTDQLLDTLRAVCLGHACYPPEHLGVVLRELREAASGKRAGEGPLNELSDRERTVLLAMIEGKSRKEIARELNMSTNTARTHTHSIFTKLRVHSAIEAVSVARGAGMRPATGQRGI